MTKHIYIGSNQKMYKTASQVQDYLLNLGINAASISRKDLTIFIIPSYTSLDRARRTVKKGDILLGAQNMYWEEEGQFTGEISPVMLQDMGIEIVLVGHSERRHVLGETDEEANRKVLSALAHDFIALLCVGETGEQKDLDLSDETLRAQIKRGLRGVPVEDLSQLWIAYEPVWAIGVGGTPASAAYANEKHYIIKQCLFELYGGDYAKIPVLYGGSVDIDNCEELAAQQYVDGLFVGRAAWDADRFGEIINAALPVFKSKERR
ncbi:MAG: triose-phosphate isomerase [Clostridiales Family XIII bacterium]|jgi:triosephosphate isomerase|nr:triose-phosphate isomerase [Clostridiales Family XIII bacterium]